jgi:nucleoside 2-deoxyribosyltransferase
VKLYIAGPMSGMPGHNFPAFEAAAALLRVAGHEVISPHEGVDLETALAMPVEDRWRHFMKRDIALLVQCDGIYLLQGWERSRGAKVEYRLASDLVMKVYFEGEAHDIARR